jgi:hypothetical protein
MNIAFSGIIILVLLLFLRLLFERTVNFNEIQGITGFR